MQELETQELYTETRGGVRCDCGWWGVGFGGEGGVERCGVAKLGVADVSGWGGRGRGQRCTLVDLSKGARLIEIQRKRVVPAEKALAQLDKNYAKRDKEREDLFSPRG